MRSLVRMFCFGFLLAAMPLAQPAAAQSEPRGGALDGERPRIVVSTDLGGSDADDQQSLVHLLVYADVFDIEGLVSSPPHDGRKQDILDIIDIYEADFAALKTHAAGYPAPGELRSVVKQGAAAPAPAKGWSAPTEGSDWIIRQAKQPDPRPLYVLVWGAITDVAQAVHDDPSIKDNLRVYFIASWNERQDPAAFAYLDEHHPDLWMVYANTTFRGWYMGGEQEGDLGNRTFVSEHVCGHGALGRYFCGLAPALGGDATGRIKMGDTPSVAYLLRGDPADPTTPHWGGRFVPHPDGRPQWWVDDPAPDWNVEDRPGAGTVSRHRVAFLRDWQTRMDRASTPAFAPDYMAKGSERAPHRGVYSVELNAGRPPADPYEPATAKVVFTRPDGASTEVDAFYNGDGRYEARAYCDTVGEWTWTAESRLPEIDGQTGRFDVVPSPLRGKLRKHPRDPHQFALDNGDWFLHIGDTGYRYVVATEPEWRAYIDQAAAMGATKIRTWFAQARSTVEALLDPAGGLALPYWREIDRRVQYALANHPDVQLQLIPYAEDTEMLKRYAADDPTARLIARHAQARWSAFPNVQWTISNDREIVRGEPMTGRRIDEDIIDRIGHDMAEREPWGTLLTNHQSRFRGYDFVEAPWSDLITVEDLDQVTGEIISEYRERGDDPVVLDEDRYEWWRNPADDRYFFRRLMWASLLSGGHATYGGLRTFEAYDGTPTRGVRGYYDANLAGLLEQGGHDFRLIHRFFDQADLDLVGFVPDDDRCGADPLRWKCAHRDGTMIVYLANPTADDPAVAAPAAAAPHVSVELGEGRYSARWFEPTTGEWTEPAEIGGGMQRLEAPDTSPNRAGDWLLLLRPLQ